MGPCHPSARPPSRTAAAYPGGVRRNIVEGEAFGMAIPIWWRRRNRGRPPAPGPPGEAPASSAEPPPPGSADETPPPQAAPEDVDGPAAAAPPAAEGAEVDGEGRRGA